MKGSKCKCGFATTSNKIRCPRCGREMKTSEWEDKGKVLSFVGLRVIPEGFNSPYDAALVEIEKDGPKVICWTTDKLKVDDEVVVTELDGKFLCSPMSKTDEQGSKSDGRNLG